MTPRVRRARALLVGFDGGRSLAECFLQGRTVVVGPADLAVLAAAGEWTASDAVCAALSGNDPAAWSAAWASLYRLCEAGALVVEGTPLAQRDAEYEQGWPWGARAGYYHFGIRDPGYAPPSAASEMLAWRLATIPQVPLTLTHQGHPTAIPLGPPDWGDPFFATVKARRSDRGFGPDPIPLAALRDALVAGLGIVAFGETGLGDIGMSKLPLKTTPSGGGRNPYEGFVVALKVAGLEPGVYHFSGTECSLLPVRSTSSLPPLSTLVGGQEWFDDAAALVCLVAHFERTAWKYPHPTAFRVVLMEAGHIAQNILLAAAHHALAATPTCGVNDTAAESVLGVSGLNRSIVYTVGLGSRSGERSSADLREVVPNPVYG